VRSKPFRIDLLLIGSALSHSRPAYALWACHLLAKPTGAICNLDCWRTDRGQKALVRTSVSEWFAALIAPVSSGPLLLMQLFLVFLPTIAIDATRGIPQGNYLP